ncbi:MAG: hypothetical protein IKA64_01920 [Clostridia bacterium]|nr:hypothetical protein [Clostridia bacterium]
MRRQTKYAILNISALLLCIAPPAAVTLIQFPLWVEKGRGATVSGLAVFLLFICAIPFFRTLKEYFKSPSAKMIWFVSLLVLWLLRTIIDEMVIVCAVGFVSNCIGALFFKWRDKYKASEVNGG